MEVNCCERMKQASTGIDCIEFVVFSDHSSWCVPGCCGGGCYVLQGMEYCPWCGSKLPIPLEEAKTV